MAKDSLRTAGIGINFAAPRIRTNIDTPVRYYLRQNRAADAENLLKQKVVNKPDDADSMLAVGQALRPCETSLTR